MPAVAVPGARGIVHRYRAGDTSGTGDCDSSYRSLPARITRSAKLNGSRTDQRNFVRADVGCTGAYIAVNISGYAHVRALAFHGRA